MQVRIVLAEPAEVVRKTVRDLLPLEFSIVAETGTAAEALEAIAKHEASLLVASSSLPDMECATFVRSARGLRDSLQVLLLSDGQRDNELVAAVRAGAHGIVLSRDMVTAIAEAIRTVGRGGFYLSGGPAKAVMQRIAGKEEEIMLTDKQHAVLRMIAEGLHNKQIARQLTLTEATVKTYRKRLYRMLGASNTAEVIAASQKIGLLD